MGKNSINRKEAVKFINEGRNNGKTDQEIYNELTQQYPNKKRIALLITSTPTKERRAKYQTYNNILLALLAITILFKILTVFNLFFNSQEPLALFLIFIFPLLNVYLFYEIARYNGAIYTSCALLAFLGFIRSLTSSANTVDLVVGVILCGAIVGLSYYLSDHLFPNYSPRTLKKDKNGDYIVRG